MSPTSLDSFIDDASSSRSSSPSPAPPRIRSRAIVSHVRPGAKVHPLSAYVNSPAHTRALTAKSESEVLKAFLVCPSLCVG